MKKTAWSCLVVPGPRSREYRHSDRRIAEKSQSYWSLKITWYVLNQLRPQLSSLDLEMTMLICRGTENTPQPTGTLRKLLPVDHCAGHSVSLVILTVLCGPFLLWAGFLRHRVKFDTSLHLRHPPLLVLSSVIHFIRRHFCGSRVLSYITPAEV